MNSSSNLSKERLLTFWQRREIRFQMKDWRTWPNPDSSIKGWLENLNKIYEGISMIAFTNHSQIIAKHLKCTFHKITTWWSEWIRSYTWKSQSRKWNLVARVAEKVSRSKTQKIGIVCLMESSSIPIDVWYKYIYIEIWDIYLCIDFYQNGYYYYGFLVIPSLFQERT